MITILILLAMLMAIVAVAFRVIVLVQMQREFSSDDTDGSSILYQIQDKVDESGKEITFKETPAENRVISDKKVILTSMTNMSSQVYNLFVYQLSDSKRYLSWVRLRKYHIPVILPLFAMFLGGIFNIPSLLMISMVGYAIDFVICHDHFFGGVHALKQLQFTGVELNDESSMVPTLIVGNGMINLLTILIQFLCSTIILFLI